MFFDSLIYANFPGLDATIYQELSVDCRFINQTHIEAAATVSPYAQVTNAIYFVLIYNQTLID